MAESITATEYNQLADQETKDEIVFGGETRNMAVGLAMFGAGLGAYITDALLVGDMPTVLGGTIVVGVCYIGLNMISDLLYKLVDPRARA